MIVIILLVHITINLLPATSKLNDNIKLHPEYYLTVEEDQSRLDKIFVVSTKLVSSIRDNV